MGKVRQKVGQLGVDAARLALGLAPGAVECVKRAHVFALGSVMWIHISLRG